MQICSLLPSATEILYALGLGDSVIGVTHECDFPSEAAKKPALIRPRVDVKASLAELDRQVNELISRGESIYSVDAELLQSLEPDLIVTQDLCHVCAASPEDLATALARTRKRPAVLTLTPHSLDDVWDDVRRVGRATGFEAKAEELAAALAAKVATVESRLAETHAQPRVLCLEWLDPFFVGGHWVPEMVKKAGGEDVLGKAGEPSFRVTAQQIRDCAAECIIVMQCGYTAERNAADFRAMRIAERFSNLPAVRNGQIYSVDANAYFSRPGPRLADGVTLLAHLLHPGQIANSAPSCAFLKI
jgi:iron complex transport system substrate-binding protein